MKRFCILQWICEGASHMGASGAARNRYDAAQAM
jgi:hypothetical protein